MSRQDITIGDIMEAKVALEESVAESIRDFYDEVHIAPDITITSTPSNKSPLLGVEVTVTI